MINRMFDIKDIRFETVACDEKFIASIRQRGIAIPVQVNVTEDGYVCIDGRKRLSACCLLAKEDSKFGRIPVMILNDYSKAGSAFWGNTQNWH